MNTRILSLILSYSSLLIMAACGPDEGPDALSERQASTTTPSALCNAVCHSASSKISPDPLQTNGSGAAGKHIIHVSTKGFYCTKCHLNYENELTHVNGQLDTGSATIPLVNFDATNPGGIWNSAITSCSSLGCHGPSILDWYGTAGWTLPACTDCHENTVGTRRVVLGASGDFGASTTTVSHHVVAGAADPTDAQCQVCHAMSEHMVGAVRLRHADTGSAIAYNPSVPSSLEPFCLSCHDALGATSTFIGADAYRPFGDGAVLGAPPYPYATRIADSWSKAYGHGPNGHHPPNDRLTCMGNGQPGAGCHGNNGTINAHGSVNQVLATREFAYDNGPGYVESDYDLCSTCHAVYPGVTKEDTFGVLQFGLLDAAYGPAGLNGNNPPYYTLGVTTHFADHNEVGGLYNDPTFWGPAEMNLHWFHITMAASDFRGTGASAGINCVNCHDVHGSATIYGAVYDEMGYINDSSDPPNILGYMANIAYTDSNYLAAYPTYCGFNCHSVQGFTNAWFEPIIE